MLHYFLISRERATMLRQSSPLTATIDGRSGRTITLRLSDNQELTVPAHVLPREIKAGEKIYLAFLTEREAQASQLELAQSLLEEILNGKD